MNDFFRLAGRILINILIGIFALTCIFPVIWMAYTSLKPNKEYYAGEFALPAHPTLQNYRAVFSDAHFITYFLNSVFVTACTLFVVLVCSAAIGYILSRFRFRGRNLIYAYFLLGIVIPSYGWLIPVYIQFFTFHLVNSRLALVLPYAAFGMPIAVFLIESYVKGIPVELEEAAMMEGAKIWQTFIRIIVPVCTPVLVTVMILSFNGSWNEFPFALVLLNKQSIFTVPLALTMFTGSYTTNYPQLVSALMSSVVPVVALYLAFSGRIIQGMTMGAVKS
jgi:raffinose/stachyose/melibiose transport system permease protein